MGQLLSVENIATARLIVFLLNGIPYSLEQLPDIVQGIQWLIGPRVLTQLVGFHALKMVKLP